MSEINFTEEQKLNAWEKGKTIPGYDPRQYRQDVAGAWMEWAKYGDNSSKLGLGWEIDHRKPIAKGGTNDEANLRALQWRNNRSKGDDYPVWNSAVSSEGGHNVEKVQSWRIDGD